MDPHCARTVVPRAKNRLASPPGFQMIIWENSKVREVPA
jgi:hypothetical protein